MFASRFLQRARVARLSYRFACELGLHDSAAAHRSSADRDTVVGILVFHVEVAAAVVVACYLLSRSCT